MTDLPWYKTSVLHTSGHPWQYSKCFCTTWLRDCLWSIVLPLSQICKQLFQTIALVRGCWLFCSYIGSSRRFCHWVRGSQTLSNSFWLAASLVLSSTEPQFSYTCQFTPSQESSPTAAKCCLQAPIPPMHWVVERGELRDKKSICVMAEKPVEWGNHWAKGGG